jgi:transcriptional regulator with XRE-family HTH domain
MTNIRDLLAFNMKERRQTLKLSQARLAERVGTSTNYIVAIECKKKFPGPDMLERIASGLEIDTPDLFSTRWYPSKTQGNLQGLRNQIIADISQVIAYRFDELEQESLGKQRAGRGTVQEP